MIMGRSKMLQIAKAVYWLLILATGCMFLIQNYFHITLHLLVKILCFIGAATLPYDYLTGGKMVFKVPFENIPENDAPRFFFAAFGSLYVIYFVWKVIGEVSMGSG